LLQTKIIIEYDSVYYLNLFVNPSLRLFGQLHQ